MNVSHSFSGVRVMFAEISVSSKRADAWPESKGKKQQAIGNVVNIDMGYLTNTGEPLLHISVADYETRGSGVRFGETRDYQKTGIVYLDKEAVVALVRHALGSRLIGVDDILDSNLALLEAAIRVEQARLKRRPKVAA